MTTIREWIVRQKLGGRNQRRSSANLAPTGRIGREVMDRIADEVRRQYGGLNLPSVSDVYLRSKIELASSSREYVITVLHNYTRSPNLRQTIVISDHSLMDSGSPSLCGVPNCIKPADPDARLRNSRCTHHILDQLSYDSVEIREETEAKPKMQPLLKDLKLAPSQRLRVGQVVEIRTVKNPNGKHDAQYTATVGRLGKHSIALDIEGKGTMSLSRDEVDGKDANIEVKVVG